MTDKRMVADANNGGKGGASLPSFGDESPRMMQRAVLAWLVSAHQTTPPADIARWVAMTPADVLAGKGAQWVWSWAREQVVTGQPWDYVVLHAAAREAGVWGGELRELTDEGSEHEPPSVQLVPVYLERLRKHAKSRRARMVLLRAADALNEGYDVDKVLVRVVDRLCGLSWGGGVE